MAEATGSATQCDARDRLALLDPAGVDYGVLTADPDLPARPAMRLKRA